MEVSCAANLLHEKGEGSGKIGIKFESHAKQ